MHIIFRYYQITVITDFIHRNHVLRAPKNRVVTGWTETTRGQRRPPQGTHVQDDCNLEEQPSRDNKSSIQAYGNPSGHSRLNYNLSSTIFEMKTIALAPGFFVGNELLLGNRQGELTYLLLVNQTRPIS